jgi:hypothetical protein
MPRAQRLFRRNVDGAAAHALRAFGDRSDGKLPTTIVGLPPDLGGLLGTLLRTAPTPPAH